MAAAGTGESPWKKARLASRQACETCRRRKQRCDGKRPACSNCDSRDIGGSCEYPGRTAPGSGTARIRAAEAHRPDGEQADPAGGIATGTPTPASPVAVFGGAGGGGGAQSTCSPVVQPPNEQAFYGDSSTFRFVSKLQAANPLERHLPRPGRRQPSLQRSGPDVNASFLSRVPPASHGDVPPREVADRLVDAYFNRVHIFYPCLHEPTFRTDLDAYWTDSDARETPATDPSWLAILYMLFAYGTEFVIASAPDQRTRNADGFVAQARYFVSLAVSHGAGLETVQALLLLTHYLQGTTELNDCWNLAGLLIRTAMSIGLHIDPTEASLSLVEKEVRKRVWAGCFIVDRTLSMKFGRPPAIPIASVNRVELPANVDDQYITSSTLQARQPEARPSRMGFFVQTIGQAYIIDKILSDLYLDEPELQRLGRTNGSFPIEVLSRLLSKVVALDGRLHGWWNDLPMYLREAPEEPDGIDLHRQRCVISIRYWHIRVLVHRQSFLIWSRLQIQDRFLQEVALSSSRSCVSFACQVLREIRDNVDRQRLGSLWYLLHYTFTSIGILLNLRRTPVGSAASVDPPADVEMLHAWAMGFLERWSPSNELAARYLSLLRQCEEHLKSRPNMPGTENSSNVAIGGATLSEPVNNLSAFPELNDPFAWMPDASVLDVNAWGFDGDFWNVERPGQDSSM